MPSDDSLPDRISMEEAAILLGVSRTQVQVLRNIGRLETYPGQGRRVGVSRAEVLALKNEPGPLIPRNAQKHSSQRRSQPHVQEPLGLHLSSVPEDATRTIIPPIAYTTPRDFMELPGAPAAPRKGFFARLRAALPWWRQ